MALIDYTSKNNYLDIAGTNEWGDIFISALCFPFVNGVHCGISLAVSWHYKKIRASLDKDKTVIVHGYSMGAAFSLELTRRLIRDGYIISCVTRGAYPVHIIKEDFGRAVIMREYGNDIVTKLFPWFRKPKGAVSPEGPPLVWYKLSWKDHTKY